jgi:protein-disulfide isomerase
LGISKITNVTAAFARGRRRLPAIIAFCAAAVCALSAVAFAAQQDSNPGRPDKDNGILSRDAILRDPDIPALGNPQGDLTIVEYFDYQCPYCKKLAPDLAKLVQDDGNIRIVLKDWPIFGDASVRAAKLALASKYQDKYPQAHDALIAANGKLNESNIDDLLANAGIDVAKATADLQTHQKSIDDLLARNGAQAEAFGFEGTPGFIVGTFRVPGVIEMNVFKQVIADARAAAKKKH